jgi:hypothetical protein
MRKTIETLCTLVLWAIFIVGSCKAVFDFVSKSDDGEMIFAHLKLISIAPVLATIIFVSMLVAVRLSKTQTTKKTMPNEHGAQWSAEELINAQTGKMVDLHFPSTGLACHVVAREKLALVLHSENTTVHLKVVPQSAEEPALALLSQSL